jgi:hypothetical protein
MEKLIEAWTQEYERKGIPSSSEQKPSNSVVSFINTYKKQKSLRCKVAADIGFGQK